MKYLEFYGLHIEKLEALKEVVSELEFNIIEVKAWTPIGSPNLTRYTVLVDDDLDGDLHEAARDYIVDRVFEKLYCGIDHDSFIAKIERLRTT